MVSKVTKGTIVKKTSPSRADYYWLPFPFPFNMLDESSQDWRQIWRDALEKACEIYKKHRKVDAWYIVIPRKFARDWMYQIAEEMGILKLSRGGYRVPKLGTPLVFYLAAPTDEWMKSKTRLNRCITRRPGHVDYTE